MSWRDTLRGLDPHEQSEVSELSPPESRILQNVQILHRGVKSEPLPSPATEQGFQRIAEKHWNRTARLMSEETYQTISEAWPGLYQRIKAADVELNRLWLAARRDGNFPDTLPAFKAICREWARLNIEAARFVRYLDRGIRRIYSQKLGEWVYLVKDKAALHGIRLKPRGTVYVGEELKSLIAVNPGPDELKKLHRAKTLFQGEIR